MPEVKTKAEHDAHIARYGTEGNWHVKPVPEVRNVIAALRNADRLRNELPKVVQVRASDWDNVILADEIARLTAYIARDRQKK